MFHSQFDALVLLAQYGLDFGLPDNEGSLIFHWAAISEDPSILNALVRPQPRRALRQLASETIFLRGLEY